MRFAQTWVQQCWLAEAHGTTTPAAAPAVDAHSAGCAAHCPLAARAIRGPSSSYCCFVMHAVWKAPCGRRQTQQGTHATVRMSECGRRGAPISTASADAPVRPATSRRARRRTSARCPAAFAPSPQAGSRVRSGGQHTPPAVSNSEAIHGPRVAHRTVTWPPRRTAFAANRSCTRASIDFCKRVASFLNNVFPPDSTMFCTSTQAGRLVSVAASK